MIKVYLYAKDSSEAKYKTLMDKRESTGLMYLNDWTVFIEWPNDMDDVSKNIEEYNPNKKSLQDKGEKQIKALEEHGKQIVKSSDEKESLTILNQKKKISEVFSNERMGEIENLSKQTDFNNLIYYFKGENKSKI